MKWKTIPGYPEYEANAKGQIRNKRTKKVREPQGRRGIVKIRNVSCSAGRWILLTFSRKPKRNELALHRDGNVKNNALSNLRWRTAKENYEDAVQHGTRGANSPQSSATKQFWEHYRIHGY